MDEIEKLKQEIKLRDMIIDRLILSNFTESEGIAQINAGPFSFFIKATGESSLEEVVRGLREELFKLFRKD